MEQQAIQLLQTTVQRVITEGRETGELARMLFRQGLPRTGRELEQYASAVPELWDRQALMSGLYSLQCTQQEDERYNLSGLYEQLVGVLDRITAVTVLAEELLELFRQDGDSYAPMSGLYGGLAVLQTVLDTRVNRLQSTYEGLEDLWRQLPEAVPACKCDGAEGPSESLWEQDDFGYIFQVLGECLTAYLDVHAAEPEQGFADRVRQYLMDFAQGKAAQPCRFTFALWSVHEMHYLEVDGGTEALRITEGGQTFPTADKVEDFTNWTYTLHRSGCTEGDLWLSGESLMDFIYAGAELEHD